MFRNFGEGTSVTVELPAAENWCWLQFVIPAALAGVISRITPTSAEDQAQSLPQFVSAAGTGCGSPACRVRRVEPAPTEIPPACTWNAPGSRTAVLAVPLTAILLPYCPGH